MSMVKLSQSGNFKHTEKLLDNIFQLNIRKELDRFGKKGVEALRDATPKDTGKTSESWGYKIFVSKGSASITWTNSNSNDGVPIALVIQYGHGTRNGGYVHGVDYINPALQPIFKEIADEIWEKVTKD